MVSLFQFTTHSLYVDSRSARKGMLIGLLHHKLFFSIQSFSHLISFKLKQLKGIFCDKLFDGSTGLWWKRGSFIELPDYNLANVLASWTSAAI